VKRVYLLTGSPGSGKTSLIKTALKDFKGKAGGFYTEELQSKSGDRYGFKLVTLDGKTGTLANAHFKSTDRVGKYGVDTKVMDTLGIAAITDAIANADVVVIDEIGRMELFSENFKKAVTDAIESGKKVLGTVMMVHHPFADTIKRLPEVELIPVMRTNNEQVLKEIREWLQEPTNV
jgi:nucleoside-triphosphatase